MHNIHARIEGNNPTGHVLLVAHYDSVPRGPGAADDGAGVAPILEIARAITSGSVPRNDIDILFTDAEEAWLPCVARPVTVLMRPVPDNAHA